jgi:hypothetical protein
MAFPNGTLLAGKLLVPIAFSPWPSYHTIAWIMFNIQPETLLVVWEANWNRTPCERAIALLIATCPELSHEEAVLIPIGYRDAILISLRETLFGSRARLLATCPICTDQSELDFALREIRSPSPASSWFSVGQDDSEVSFRLPCSHDLLALRFAKPSDPKQFLIRACLAEPFSSRDNLTAELVDRISKEMADLDPQANVMLAITCANCLHEWEARFDIVTLLWLELDAWAQRLIGEVHVLAMTYAWDEKTILEMSPLRRQIYLNMISS